MAKVSTLMHKPAAVARETVAKIKEQKPKLDSAIKRVDENAPSVFAGLALGSIIGSLVLFMRKSKQEAIFVGLWAPTLLALGLFYGLLGVGKKR